MKLSESTLKSYFEQFKKAYKGEIDGCIVEASSDFEKLIVNNYGKVDIDMLEFDSCMKNIGSFSTVFATKIKNSAKKLIIKVQQKDENNFAKFVKKTVVNEKTVLEKCKCPNVTPLYCYADLKMTDAAGDEYDVYFLIFPFYEYSAYDFLKDPRRTPEQYTKFVLDICKALKLVSSQGYIHGDVRASNLFVHTVKNSGVEEYVGVLGDFGVATQELEWFDYADTFEEELLGIDYPPENGNQSLMRDNFTFDFYTLARTIEIIHDHRICKSKTYISPELQQILDVMTADQKNARYQSADEIIAELEKILKPCGDMVSDTSIDENRSDVSKIKNEPVDVNEKQDENQPDSKSVQELEPEPETKQKTKVASELKKCEEDELENASADERIIACKEKLLDYKKYGDSLDEAYQLALNDVKDVWDNANCVRLSTYITLSLYLMARNERKDNEIVVQRKNAFLENANRLKQFAQNTPDPITQYFYAYIAIKFDELDYKGDPYDDIKLAAERGCVLAMVKYGQFCIDSHSEVIKDYETGLDCLINAREAGYRYAQIYISDFVKSMQGIAGEQLKKYEKYIVSHIDKDFYKTKRYWIIRFI